MDQIISGAQVIKLYAWEKPFEKLIAAARKSELKSILQSSYVRSFYMMVALFTTRFALFCTVLSSVLLNGSENISVPKIFLAAYLLGQISGWMGRLFIRGVSEMSESYMALKRLQIFLEYEERSGMVQSDPVSEEVSTENIAISIKSASAEWSVVKFQKDKKTRSYKSNNKSQKDNSEQKDYKPFKLQEIDLEVVKGKLIFIVGSVGSGKSTLLQMLLKELPLSGGTMAINGSISYASQESWIFTSTIRQNITFGQPMDRARYDDVIKTTALGRDLAQFSDGDMTLAGEHGAGLSGGQKARIK